MAKLEEIQAMKEKFRHGGATAQIAVVLKGGCYAGSYS